MTSTKPETAVDSSSISMPFVFRISRLPFARLKPPEVGCVPGTSFVPSIRARAYSIQASSSRASTFLSKIPETVGYFPLEGRLTQSGSLSLTFASATATSTAFSICAAEFVLAKPTAPFTIARIPIPSEKRSLACSMASFLKFTPVERFAA